MSGRYDWREMAELQQQRDKRPVVVGIDGWDPSKAALSWAARYAADTRRQLSVIVVWHLPTSFGWPLPVPEGWDPKSDARTMLEHELKEVLGTLDSLDLILSVAEGSPAKVLTEASKSASLVVVGNRGRGEIAGMLLGSVSEFLTAHAQCPVVVVRGNRTEEGRKACA